MISEKMKQMVAGSSVVRAMFEEGKKMAEQFGAENVYDFSLGNPNVPAPQAVNEAMKEILETENSLKVHGYMNNSGYEEVRAAIADSLNARFETSFNQSNIVMTVGAAGGLNVALKVLLNPGDEVILFAPYFGEYNNYVANFDGVVRVVPADTETFMPNLAALEQMIGPKTKALIINSPNNPTGVVYTEETIRRLAAILEAKQKEFGASIYLISDEPYRELAYDGIEVPYLTKYYANTIVGYSYSKSLSLPGERIGYLVLPDELDDAADVKAAANVATRILGFVNAPALQQLAVARCLDQKTDIGYYDRNRKALCEGLKKLGFTFAWPDGAFYLFLKSPEADEKAFVAKAKEERILIVPGSSFSCPGWVRVAYCVSYETIVGAMPGFAKLAESYGLCGEQQ